MDYLAKWLQRAYAKLYFDYAEDLFTFEEAKICLALKKQTVLNVVSYLKRAGWLTVFEKKKNKRLYRLLEPSDTFFSLTKMKNLGHIKQKKYIPLIIKTSRYLWRNYRDNLISLVLYGSVGRGTATPYSDVDMLVILADSEQEKTFGERLDDLYQSVEAIEGERRFLRAHNILTDISFYPLTKKEASHLLPIYLDIVYDGLILLDTNGYFGKLMTKVKSLLRKYGAKKVVLGSQWYWQLGKRFEIERIKIES
ncbi:MAG: nucleotidyltransferase domain-containing protein [Candidatus Ranarchaeia archaeon]